MKIMDLKNYVYDKMCVYKESSDIDGEYIDIYKGFVQEAPCHILELEVRSVGAKRKGIVDIRVD